MSKILVVSSLTEVATANYLVRALREAGHSLLVYSDVRNELANVVGPSITDVAKLTVRKSFDPDLVLFIEGGTMRVFPTGLEKLACRTAWYGIDTHMDYGKHLRIGRLFDVTFVAQKQYVERLHADGLRQVFWLPLAFAPEIAPAGALERKYELAYVGSDDPRMHPERHSLLAAIRHKIEPVFIGKANPREMMRIYTQAKMVFNKSVNNDINMRYFEAMGSGAVLLTDPVHDNGVEELFECGRHFLEYEDAGSLIRILQLLRAEPDRVRCIGDEARRHVLDHHTYRDRVDVILAVIGSSKKCATVTPDAYFTVFFSLKMPEGLLGASALALRQMGGGRALRAICWLPRVCLVGLGAVIRLFERLRTWLWLKRCS